MRRGAHRLQSQALSPLPGTRAEVTSIYQTLVGRQYEPDGADQSERVRVLLGADATEQRLYQSAAGAGVLHIATHHLVFPQQRAGESALALSWPAVYAADNDGFLQLDDVLERWRGRLDDCRLVVLSGCETQRGVQQLDEGVFAMPIGFLYAGAPAVIATLWPIEDQSSAELMAEFYRQVVASARGDSLAALNAARLAMKAKFPAPYHWAPYVHVGAPSVVGR